MYQFRLENLSFLWLSLNLDLIMLLCQNLYDFSLMWEHTYVQNSLQFCTIYFSPVGTSPWNRWTVFTVAILTVLEDGELNLLLLQMAQNAPRHPSAGALRRAHSWPLPSLHFLSFAKQMITSWWHHHSSIICLTGTLPAWLQGPLTVIGDCGRTLIVGSNSKLSCGAVALEPDYRSMCWPRHWTLTTERLLPLPFSPCDVSLLTPHHSHSFHYLSKSILPILQSTRKSSCDCVWTLPTVALAAHPPFADSPVCLSPQNQAAAVGQNTLWLHRVGGRIAERGPRDSAHWILNLSMIYYRKTKMGLTFRTQQQKSLWEQQISCCGIEWHVLRK